MKKFLLEKAPKKKKSLNLTVYKDIINLVKQKHSKSVFLQQYKFITDQSLMQQEVKLKTGTKKIYYTDRKIYKKKLILSRMKMFL